MAYRIKVERVNDAGIPTGPTRVYEAADEARAVTIAVSKVASGRVERPGVATVSDPSGRLLFTYSGRVGA